MADARFYVTIRFPDKTLTADVVSPWNDPLAAVVQAALTANGLEGEGQDWLVWFQKLPLAVDKNLQEALVAIGYLPLPDSQPIFLEATPRQYSFGRLPVKRVPTMEVSANWATVVSKLGYDPSGHLSGSKVRPEVPGPRAPVLDPILDGLGLEEGKRRRVGQLVADLLREFRTVVPPASVRVNPLADSIPLSTPPGEATPPLLDFAELIQPIPGDNPAGNSVPFDVRQALEDGRREDQPDDWAPDDPTRPETLKKADWPGIIRLAQETLKNHSKDLLVAARLTEALTKHHGYAGLRDGLHLFRLLLDECWDRINPPIEDGDVDVRAAPLNWLDDPDRGARFPNTVRSVPVLFGEGVAYSYLDWHRAKDGKGTVSMEDIEMARVATPADRSRTIAEDLDQAIDEIKQLISILNMKMGANAPAFTGLRQAVGECKVLVKEDLKGKESHAVDSESFIACAAPDSRSIRELLRGAPELAPRSFSPAPEASPAPPETLPPPAARPSYRALALGGRSNAEESLSPPAAGSFGTLRAKAAPLAPVAAKQPEPALARRRATVRHYSCMNPQRMFPLLVILSEEAIREVVKKHVEQRQSESFQVAVDSFVEIEPILPGCACYPAKHILQVRENNVQASFWIVPQVLGKLAGARVVIRQDNRTLAEVPLEMRVAKQTAAVVTGLLSLVVPYASALLKHYQLDFETQLQEGFGLYRQLVEFLLCALTPEMLFLLLLGLTVLLYLWARPRQRDVFWDIEPAGAHGR